MNLAMMSLGSIILFSGKKWRKNWHLGLPQGPVSVISVVRFVVAGE